MSELALPRVSICIPTYNGSAGLEITLDSAVKQDYSNLEIIVLDNASTDNTREIVMQFEQRDSRVKYHVNQENIGATNNFNAVVNLAGSDYCMWLADDDWIESGYISACMEELVADPSLSLVSGRNEVVYEDGRVRRGQVVNLLFSNRLLRVLAYYALVGDNGFFYGVHRKSTLDQVSLVDKIGGDWFFVAATVYLGKLKTVDGAMLHRSGEGASSDLKKLAISHGLSGIFRLDPNFAAAVGACQDIWSKNSVYTESGVLTRSLLGSLVFVGLVARKVLAQRVYRGLRFISRKTISAFR